MTSHLEFLHTSHPVVSAVLINLLAEVSDGVKALTPETFSTESSPDTIDFTTSIVLVYRGTFVNKFHSQFLSFIPYTCTVCSIQILLVMLSPASPPARFKSFNIHFCKHTQQTMSENGRLIALFTYSFCVIRSLAFLASC
jgi:hypothetical protein